MHTAKLFSHESCLYKSHNKVIRNKLHPFPRHMMSRNTGQSSAKQSPFLNGRCTQPRTQHSYCKSPLVSFITYGACFVSDPVLICDTRLLHRAAGETHVPLPPCVKSNCSCCNSEPSLISDIMPSP